MRFLFLNQYAPPEAVPTARLLGELAEGLRAGGHTVEILSQRESYEGRPATGGSRLKRELAAARTILRAGLFPRGGRPDVILALSSPPGLPVVGALLSIRHRARLAHWAMDLYPELALALGEMPPGSAVVRVVRTAMNRAYRRASLVVALDEDMRAHLQAFCRVPVRVMEPWSAPTVEREADEAAASEAGSDPSGNDASSPWTWLYSGNLGRAHEWKTLLDAQALLEARGLPVTLIFQGDGASRAPAMEYAEKRGLRRCEWKGYVPEGELLPTLMRARMLVVTQRPETRGLLWPSKLALLERLPRPVLYVGSTDGAIATRLRERGHAGVFAPGEPEVVAEWVERWFHGENTWNAADAKPFSTHAEKRRELESWLAGLAR